MTEAHPRPDSNGKARESSGKMPRWVKVFMIIAIFLVLLFVILHLTGLSPAGHGP